MPYRYATEDQDLSDYASGRVIYNLPGAAAFPVRLASEMFLRALNYLPYREPVALFDPTCGAAYHLTALGFLHGEKIARILASDSDERAAALARHNLGLLTLPGLERREAELRAMFASYGKESHAKALESAMRLRNRLQAVLNDHAVHSRVFRVNALDQQSLREALRGETAHVLLSDVPYGQLSSWQTPESEAQCDHSPLWRLLDSLHAVINDRTVLAISADKAQKIAHPGYQRIERFRVGRRQVALLRRSA